MTKNEEKFQLLWASEKIKRAAFIASAHPAVKILALLGLPHPLNIRREDGEESIEYSIRLRSAGVFGKEVVHDG